MLSMPPEITILLLPDNILSYPIIIAFIPDPHILLIVVAPTFTGIFAPMLTCLAGACPKPAGKTQPIITSSIWLGESLVSCKFSFTTELPNSVALIFDKLP